MNVSIGHQGSEWVPKNKQTLDLGKTSKNSDCKHSIACSTFIERCLFLI